MRKLAPTLIAVTLVAVTAALPASPTRTAPSVRNGRIVFHSLVHGLNQVFTINANGAGLQQVTHLVFANSGVPGSENPNWSPDGSTIIFDSDYQQTPAQVVSVFTIKPDGSSLTKLPISVGAFDGAPAYSHDGTMISFDQDVGPSQPTVHGIYVANADGSNPRRVTTGIAGNNAFDTLSDWSPDGHWLAFSRVNNANLQAVYKVRLDGSGLKRLTPWAVDASDPKWSPDGSKILFDTYAHAKTGKSGNIFTIRSDGTGQQQLTHFKGSVFVHAGVGGWSPDGKQIVWHRRGADPNGPGINQLFIMNANGSHIRQLTHLPHGSNPSHAAWGTLG